MLKELDQKLSLQCELAAKEVIASILLAMEEHFQKRTVPAGEQADSPKDYLYYMATQLLMTEPQDLPAHPLARECEAFVLNRLRNLSAPERFTLDLYYTALRGAVPSDRLIALDILAQWSDFLKETQDLYDGPGTAADSPKELLN